MPALTVAEVAFTFYIPPLLEKGVSYYAFTSELTTLNNFTVGSCVFLSQALSSVQTSSVLIMYEGVVSENIYNKTASQYILNLPP
jgi:hypothetical protein